MTASAGPRTSLPPAATAGGDKVDLQVAARAVHELLVALGENPTAEHLQDTPRRVAAAYAELLGPAPFAMTTFANE
jgi:GTP cyclohydrolase I